MSARLTPAQRRILAEYDARVRREEARAAGRRRDADEARRSSARRAQAAQIAWERDHPTALGESAEETAVRQMRERDQREAVERAARQAQIRRRLAELDAAASPRSARPVSTAPAGPRRRTAPLTPSIVRIDPGVAWRHTVHPDWPAVMRPADD
jgi:hypothetical protein